MRIENFDAKTHDRVNFSSTSEALNDYLRTRLYQDEDRGASKGFVAVNEDFPSTVLGYYTLSAAMIALNDIPQQQRKKMARYPALPAALIGRLAVDQRFAGQGIGPAMLVDACQRILNADMAISAVLVEAKDEKAASFYRHFGFTALLDDPMRMLLPLAAVKAAAGA
jgi:GNAT superfamily N-acetyltransferase